ncbi:MAG: hypothetical protein MUE69_23895, partial [Myxococcota bacterium]|nr:hypothetical protein [Myxococcota bacterium]
PPRVRAPNEPDPGASQLPGEVSAGGVIAEAAPTELVDAPTGELVLPIALQGLRIENLRVVVFAAADEDTGAAYDGIFLELEQPEPVVEAPPPPRRRPAPRTPRGPRPTP